MAIILINAPQEQRIATREYGLVSCLVYSNPAYFEPKIMARDFGSIEVGDELILCRESELRLLARVDEVVEATDANTEGKFVGKAVRLLKGSVIGRFSKIGVGASAERMYRQGIAPPNLINLRRTGFKQGAFCERLNQLQAGALLALRD